MVFVEAIAGLVGAAALTNVPGRSATNATPPSSEAIIP
jgi:hypothetical protein